MIDSRRREGLEEIRRYQRHLEAAKEALASARLTLGDPRALDSLFPNHPIMRAISAIETQLPTADLLGLAYAIGLHG